MSFLGDGSWVFRIDDQLKDVSRFVAADARCIVRGREGVGADDNDHAVLGQNVDAVWFASITDYCPLSPVPWEKHGAKLEQVASNRFAVAVRELPEDTFQQIVELGGSTPTEPPASSGGLSISFLDQSLQFGNGLLITPTPSRAGSHGATSPRGPSQGRSLRAKMIGDRGEQLVFDALRRDSVANGWTDLRWPAAEGEFPGWDIEFPDNGDLVGVEVKSTVAVAFHAITITSNEWESAERLRTHYRLALVANVESTSPELEWIDDPWGQVHRGHLVATPSEYRLNGVPTPRKTMRWGLLPRRRFRSSWRQ